MLEPKHSWEISLNSRGYTKKVITKDSAFSVLYSSIIIGKLSGYKNHNFFRADYSYKCTI